MRILSKVLSHDPKNAQAHYIKAATLVLMRRYSEAKIEYKEVLHLTPENSELANLAHKGLEKLFK